MLCNKCHKEKELSEFSFRDKQHGVRHKMCKVCHKSYRKQHYLINKEKYIKKALRWNGKQREVLREYLFKKLSESCCVDCGEKDIEVLDFDHIHNKKLSISVMFRHRYSTKAIEEEISKCVVRCANCHRRKSAKEISSWKFRWTHTKNRAVG
ncbi:MAG: hypothetical protein COY81_04515 [Candidatus Pacebacteria bacterium CG_4_10_14_0_8_um_filter_43_12]|nr:MAG: hypothetical protein COY81_04515 [Candidatus Pacebacteria bacterium CG_4_10_14_0_8_um_filter_43_12]